MAAWTEVTTRFNDLLLVVRGSARSRAVGAGRVMTVLIPQLQLTDEKAWRTLSQQLKYWHEARRLRLRLRRDPDAYLAALEHCLLTPSLRS